MRHRLSVLVGACVLIGSLFAAAPALAAGVPTAPYTALSVAGAAGADSLTRWGGASTSVGDLVRVEYASATSVSVSGGSDGGAYLTVNTPTGVSFTAGTSFPVVQTADATHGGLFLSSVAQNCRPRVTGTVTVLDVTTSDDGAPTSIGLDVSADCDGAHQVAAFRWRSPSPWTGVSLQPGSPLEDAKLGEHVDYPVTLRASGTTSLPTVTGVTMTGDVDAFTITSDGCTGVTLRAGKSCTVTVRGYPRHVGEEGIDLVLAHAGATPFEVRLGVTGRDVGTGTYWPYGPDRVLDTRKGIGARAGQLAHGATLHLDLGLSMGEYASAYVLNLTVDHPAGAGYLTAYPTGTPRPATSSINFPAGWQGANLVTVPVGTNASIDIYNGGAATSVIADVVGFYLSPELQTRKGGYHVTGVERILDTRTWGHGKLPGGYYATVPIQYENDGGHIAAISVTVTAVNPTRQGYLTTWDGDTRSIPETSTLNFGPSTGVISNAAIVPTSYCPNDKCHSYATIGVLNQSAAPLDVVVDINGFFDDGLLPATVRYTPSTRPTRIVDTRSGLGTSPLGADTTRTVTAPASVAGYDTVALDANVAAVAPTQRTYVTAWPTYDDYPRPQASILNPLRGQTISNHAIVEVGYGNRFNLYNALGTTNLVLDVSGTFELFPPTPPDKQDQARPAVAAATVAPRNRAAARPDVHRA